MRELAFIALILLVLSGVQAKGTFTDLGVGSPVAESRGLVTTQNAQGQRIAVICSLDNAPRGWVLLVNVDTEEVTQLRYPERVPNSPPFASLLSANGRFYTFAGKVLLELDVDKGQWLFDGIPAQSESCYCGSAMVDGPDGLIYAGGYPTTALVSYDPQTGEMKDYGRLDPAEQYVMSLVAGADGWLYAGIGTARQNIVAANPKTGEIRQIAEEADRVLGSGAVRIAADGVAYGAANSHWYRLENGEGKRVENADVPTGVSTGAIGWGQRTGAFADGSRVAGMSLPDRWLDIIEKDGTKRRLEFDYEAGGADITSVALGPDGRIYASTCHPMHFVAYDPKANTLEDWGPVPRVGGGNFCAMDRQGDCLYGAAYAGGFFYEYDTTRPWNNETGDAPNPRLIRQFEGDITRPRACLAHPDGKHVIMAGYAGYGMVGGGLGIYNQETKETALIKHEDLIPFQSTITLGALPDGNIVGGTCISAPGGGHPQAKEGVLYILDWATRKVIFQTAPVQGAANVFSLVVGRDGLVYGVAAGSRFFVFDPEKREVVHTEDLSIYGGTPRHTFAVAPDGTIYGVFSNAVVRITPGTFAHEKLADIPRTAAAGVVYHEGRLYYSSGSHLWSYEIGEG